MKWAILITVGAIAAVALFVYIKLGLYKPVEISLKEVASFRIITKPHIGPYHKIVPIIQEVEKWAKENHEECEESLGEYIDDPETVPEERLRSEGGCVVRREWTELPEGLTYREIPRKLYVEAVFAGAPSAGPLKAYPRAHDFIKQNNRKIVGPIMEIYRILPDQSVTTRYLFPVE